MPCVMASQPTTSFPEIKFSVFSDFISSTSNSNISLATVPVVLSPWLKIQNHAWQKNPQLSNENSIVSSAWMHALCHQLKGHLPHDGFAKLFKKKEFTSKTWENDLSRKLDGFAECLGLTPCQNGSFHNKVLPISQKSIQPEYIICPLEMECTKSDCHGCYLFMSTKKKWHPYCDLNKGDINFQGCFCSYWSVQKLPHTLLCSSSELQRWSSGHDQTELLSNSAWYL